MSNEYVGIIITPDAIRDGLAEQILNDLLTATTMRILWQKYWRVVSMDTILSIYPRLAGKPSFAPVAKTMMTGSCLVVITCGENLYPRIREVKGKIKFNPDYTKVEVTGLRLKYRAWSFQELDQLKSSSHYRRQAILDRIFEFRMHTTDNLKETANLCMLCMDEEDVERLKLVAPLLYSEVVRLKDEIA